MSGGFSYNIDNVVPTPKQVTQADPANLPAQKPAEETSPGFNRELLSWEGASFEFVEKGAKWYLAASLIALLIIGYLVWIRDWFSVGITVIVSAVLFWYVSTARPKNQAYAITPLGVRIDGRDLPFAEMHSFWMVYNDRVKKLYLTLAKKYLPVITLDLAAADPTKVRAILTRKLPEQQGQGENILDRLLRTLKI